jgi:adenylate cyclase
LNPHVHWLLATGRFAPTPAALLSGLASRLSTDGFDLIRINVQPRTLHPEIGMILYVWRPSEVTSELRSTAKIVRSAHTHEEFGIVQEIAIGHGASLADAADTDAFRASPFYAIYQGAPRVRSRIVAGVTTFDFPILRDLAAAGATDYLAWPLRLGDGTVSAISVTTRKAGGFTDAEIETLESLLDPLAMCMEIHLRGHVARSLLHTYLGPGPGEAVLAGHVRRGDVSHIEAAIWFSDLRGFTQASAVIEPTELVAWLNEYFGVLAVPVTENQGEILKFIGDAMLAVFPVTHDRGRAAACEAALRAAMAGNTALDALNARRVARGLPELQHGIGLHVGNVEYGNIGAERRLDFTVIGQAVNLASRIESLCGKLGRRTLASAELAALAGGGLSPVGTFELKGLPGQHAVHGL